MQQQLGEPSMKALNMTMKNIKSLHIISSFFIYFFILEFH